MSTVSTAPTAPNAPRRPAFLIGFAATTAFLLAAYFAWSGRNERLLSAGQTLFLPLTPLDAELPLVPAFIWIYLAYYPAFLGMAYVAARDERALSQIVAAFGFIAGVSWAIFYLLPSQMNQPALRCAGLSCSLLRLMYASDEGHHIFPSLHVAYPTASYLLLRRFKPRWAKVWLGLTVGISLSTVLLKRHALVDVPAGALVGAWGVWFAHWFTARPAAAWARWRAASRQPGGPAGRERGNR